MDRILQKQHDLLQKQSATLTQIEGHSRADKMLQGIQLVTAYKNLKDSDRIADEIDSLEDVAKEGLLSSKGTGLNANVLKLIEVIRQSSMGVVANDPQFADQLTPLPPAIDPAQLRPVSEEPFYKSVGQTIKGAVKDFFSVKGFFDLDNSKGLFTDTLKKKVARDEYVADQQLLDPTAKRSDLQRKFNDINKVVGEQQSVEKRIEGMRAQGYSDDQIAKTGLLDKQQTLTERRASIDNRINFPVSSALNPVKRDTTPSATSSEMELENIRLFTEQNELMYEIRDNTELTFSAVHKGLIDKRGGGLHQTAMEILEQLKTMGTLGAAGGLGGLGSLVPDIDINRRPTPTGRTPKGTTKVPSKVPSILGKNLLKGGSLLAIGAGAYEAYSGWTSASAEEEAAIADIEQLQQAGEISDTQAADLKQQVVDTTDVKQSEAVGGGVGTAAGAILGMKAGAMLGTVAGPVGTVVGGAVGGIVGGIAGSGVGQDIGRWGAQGWQAVRGLFGGKKSKDLAVPVAPSVEASFQEITFAQNDPSNHKKFVQYKKTVAENLLKSNPGMDAEVAEQEAHTAAIIKFKSEIERAGAGSVKVSSPGERVDLAQPSTDHVARGTITPASTPMVSTPASADAIYSQSEQNAAAAAVPAQSAPVVINAPTNSNVNQTSNYAVPSPPRNTDSSFKEYSRSRFAYR